MQLDIYFARDFTLYLVWDPVGTAGKWVQKYGILVLTSTWIWVAQLLGTTLSQAYKGMFIVCMIMCQWGVSNCSGHPAPPTFLQRMKPGILLVWMIPLAALLVYTGKPSPPIPIEVYITFFLAGGAVVYSFHGLLAIFNKLFTAIGLTVVEGWKNWFKWAVSAGLYVSVVLGVMPESVAWMGLLGLTVLPQSPRKPVSKQEPTEEQARLLPAELTRYESKEEIVDRLAAAKAERDLELQTQFSDGIRQILFLLVLLQVPYALPSLIQASLGLQPPIYTEAWSLLLTLLTFIRIGTFTRPPNKGERLFILTLCEPFFWLPIWATSRWTGNSWVMHAAHPLLLISLWLCDGVSRYFGRTTGASQVTGQKRKND